MVVNKNFKKVYMPLDCDRKRLERILVLGATLGWVDTLKRRIREIRGLYWHVVVGEDMLGGLRPEKTHVTQDASCYAGCAGCAGQPSPLVPVQLLPLSA